ncbi:hypothetical protein V8F20_005176 [Naviculisporaceae sp. PSN 640]
MPLPVKGRNPLVSDAQGMALVESIVPEIILTRPNEETNEVPLQEETTPGDADPCQHANQTENGAPIIPETINRLFSFDTEHHRKWSRHRADSLLRSCDFDRLFKWQPDSPLNKNFTTEDKLSIVQETIDSLEDAQNDLDSRAVQISQLIYDAQEAFNKRRNEIFAYSDCLLETQKEFIEKTWELTCLKEELEMQRDREKSERSQEAEKKRKEEFLAYIERNKQESSQLAGELKTLVSFIEVPNRLNRTGTTQENPTMEGEGTTGSPQ